MRIEKSEAKTVRWTLGYFPGCRLARPEGDRRRSAGERSPAEGRGVAVRGGVSCVGALGVPAPARFLSDRRRGERRGVPQDGPKMF